MIVARTRNPKPSPDPAALNYRNAKLGLMQMTARKVRLTHTRHGEPGSETFEVRARGPLECGELARFLVEAYLNHYLHEFDFEVDSSEERGFLAGLGVRPLQIFERTARGDS